MGRQRPDRISASQKGDNMQSRQQWTTKTLTQTLLGFACCVGLACPTFLYAENVTVPFTFHNGDVADANQVNANFSTLQDAVNGLHITMSGNNIAVGEFTLV